MTTKKYLRELGERDARAGKAITAFYDAPLAGHHRHNENARAEYEIGYRAAKQEMRREMREGGHDWTKGTPVWLALAPNDADERRLYFVSLITVLSRRVTEAQMREAVDFALKFDHRKEEPDAP